MLFTTEEFFRYTDRGLSKLSAQVLMELATHLVTYGFNDQIWTWRNPENNREIRNVSNVMGMYLDPLLQPPEYGGHLGITDYVSAFYMFYYAANGGINSESTAVKTFERWKTAHNLERPQLRRDSGRKHTHGTPSGRRGVCGVTTETKDLPIRQQEPNQMSTMSPAHNAYATGLFGPNARTRDFLTLQTPGNYAYCKIYRNPARESIKEWYAHIWQSAVV
jgi:hypothetical protein